jgi:hypothetical protein
MTDTRTVAPSVSARHVPRTDLTRFVVEGDSHPELLPRLLGLVARHSLVPFTIAAHRRDDAMEVTFEVDGLPGTAPDILLARIESMVSVRAARLQPCTMG